MLSELPAVLCLLVPAALGAAICAAAQVGRDRCETAAIGTILGVVSFATLTFLLTLLFPFSPALVAAVLAAFGLATAVICARSAAIANLRALPWGAFSAAVLLAAIALSLPITHRLMTTEAGGITATFADSWDLAWHSSVTRSFIVGQSAAPDYLLMGGIALKYPFITDFFTAIVIQAGATLPHAITGTAMAFFPLVFFTYFMLLRSLTTSRAVTILALLLFACNSATFGFTVLFDDPSHLSHISEWPWLLSGRGFTDAPFYFANLATHVLKHQRAYLLGLPLAFLGLTLVARGRSRGELAVAGVLIGLGPLVHAHNNIPISLAVLAMATTVPRPLWKWFAVPALLLGLPEVGFYAIHSNVPAQFAVSYGWMANDSTGAVMLWILNSGAILPLTVAGLFLRPPPLVLRLGLVGLLLFALANTFQFAVWKWDNYKLLLFWAAFVAPAVAWATCWAWAQLRSSPRLPPVARLAGLALVAALYGLHLLTGSLDILHELLVSPPRRMVWSTDDIAVADRIAATTPPRAIIAATPTIFSPVGLSGRSWYVGEKYMVESHGYGALGERRLDAQLIYMKLGRDTFPLFERPDYLLIMRTDRNNYKIRDLVHLGPPMWTIGDTTLYRVRSRGEPTPIAPRTP